MRTRTAPLSRRRFWISSLSSTTGIVSSIPVSVRLSLGCSIMVRLKWKPARPHSRAGSSHKGASTNLLFGASNSPLVRVFDLDLGASNGLGNTLRALVRLLADGDFFDHPLLLGDHRLFH